MSTSASTSADCKFTVACIEFGTSVKTNSNTKHTGANNYQTWETQVEYLLLSIHAEEIVFEYLQLPSDTTCEKLQLD
jgi:hypothetical protein